MSSGTDSPRERHGSRIAATLASTLLACALAMVTPGTVRGATVSRTVEARFASNAQTVPVVVTFRDGVDEHAYRNRPGELERALRDDARRTRARLEHKLHGKGRWFWLVNGVAADVTPAEVAELAADPNVLTIDADPQVTVAGTQTATVSENDSWGVTAIGAHLVWRQFGVTGAGVRVGSIDTGADGTNPDLRGAIVAWRDFVNGGPAPYDDNGHGTHTLGTMVARNTRARVGVAPGAQAIVAKAIRADGTAMGSDLLAAAEWMTDPDGDPQTADFPAVVNNSWTAAGADNQWFRPMVQRWLAMGIVPVFGAGNTGSTIGNPASYPEAIAVGSIDADGTVAESSSRGLVTWALVDSQVTVTKPDLTAPGVFISSTLPGGFGTYSGSSMAAPHVAGAVALIKQARPDLDPAAIRALLTASATDRGAPGLDLDYGAGSLDVLAAIGATGAPLVPQTQPSPAAASAKGVRVRVLRVTRRGGFLYVRGRISGQAKIRASMRRTGTATTKSLTGAQTKAVPVRAGMFTIKLRANRLQRGRYVLKVTASGRTGQPVSTATRRVRIG